MPAPDGLLLIDKPSGWTSHDVVARLRRLCRTRKVGHAGTLDPMATGLLVCGIGRATRLLGHLALTDKDYDARVLLGVATTTDDAEGEVLERCDAAQVDGGDIEAALAALRGPILQVPSSVSAIKVAGVRSYVRARAGQSVELAARPVTVSRLELTGRAGPELELAVTCSTGTYVRALARDLGSALGVGAHLTALRRTRVGPYPLADATDLEALSRAGDDGVDAAVLPLAAAVAAAFPVRHASDDEAARLRHGGRLAASGTGRTPVGAFAPDGELLALLEDLDDGSAARPLVVFAAS